MNKPTIEELQAQVKQLAAENAALKLWSSQSVELWDAGCDMDGHMRDVPSAVITDAILASLRAEGVEMAIEAVKPLIAIEFQYSDFDACVSANYKFPESDLVGKVEMVEWMQDFAAKLSSKSEVQL